MGEEQEQEQVKAVEDSKDSSVEVERAKTEETQENKMGIADSVVRPSWFTPKRYHLYLFSFLVHLPIPSISIKFCVLCYVSCKKIVSLKII